MLKNGHKIPISMVCRIRNELCKREHWSPNSQMHTLSYTNKSKNDVKIMLVSVWCCREPHTFWWCRHLNFEIAFRYTPHFYCIKRHLSMQTSIEFLSRVIKCLCNMWKIDCNSNLDHIRIGIENDDDDDDDVYAMSVISLGRTLLNQQYWLSDKFIIAKFPKWSKPNVCCYVYTS